MQTLIECTELDPMVDFFVELGLRLDTISPADDPREVVLQSSSGSVRLRRVEACRTSTVVLRSDDLDSGVRTGPEGLVVEVYPLTAHIAVPNGEPSLTVVEASVGESGAGRAGMWYRDLLPDRWGGRFIASHITIPGGGEVPDYVHFHRIRFQMIFVAAGWVDVIYEDQGEAFRLHAGDCVLQPPEIRHRVLRSSPGLEVIEIGCPAVHDTIAEPVIELPTANLRPDRDFGGQRFVRHIAAESASTPWVVSGFDLRETGIGAATDGLAGARVYTRNGERLARHRLTHDGEFAMIVVLDGEATLHVDTVSSDDSEGDAATGRRMAARSAATFPPGRRWGWSEPSDDFSYLEVAVPDGAVRLRS